MTVSVPVSVAMEYGHWTLDIVIGIIIIGVEIGLEIPEGTHYKQGQHVFKSSEF